MKKHKIGLRTRVFLEVGAIIAVCLAALTVINSQLLENVYLWNEEHTLKTIAQNAEEEDTDYVSTLSAYEKKNGVSIDLYDEYDNYIYEGSGSFISGTKLIVVSRTVNDDGSYFNILKEEDSTTQYILYGKDFKDGRHIEITTQKDPLQENATLATKVTTIISIAALVLSLIFISAYAKRFTKPLIEMGDIAENMSKLDFSRKCKVERNDEIGALAENINTLSTSLDTALTELKSTNEQLQKDIDKERQLEKMRKDFVSSASHELKTPIAIIRGYAEGLKMTVEPENSGALEYCDIIMNEADKMNELVLNLLEESLYSSGAKTIYKEPFSINEFIAEFMKKARPLFDDKGIDATFITTENYIGYGDIKQLDTALTNLVSNACSHASGEKKIVISVREADNKYIIAVFNTGSYVDDKDRDSIFTSFYRADKAHSRSEGRFGLGLAIVKSIMDLHGCECGFENKEDGVSFWFEVGKVPAEVMPDNNQLSEGKSNEN